MPNERVDLFDKLTGFCPYCKKLMHFSWCHVDNGSGYHDISTYLCEYYIKNKAGTWAMAECPSCSNLVLIKMKVGPSVHNRNGLDLVEIIPAPLPSPTDDKVKREIKIDIDEAKICFSVKAYRACAIMCRRALQTICIDNGDNSNATLKGQIKELLENGTITKKIADWVTSVRWVGNDAAHPKNEEVTLDDADKIFKLTEQIVYNLYVTDALSKEANKTYGRNA